MNLYPTRAGNLANHVNDVGTTLVSVNDVRFGDEAGSPARPGVLLGRGLTIEGQFTATNWNGMPFVNVTVWMGAAMVTLTLNTTDVVVLGTPE